MPSYTGNATITTALSTESVRASSRTSHTSPVTLNPSTATIPTVLPTESIFHSGAAALTTPAMLLSAVGLVFMLL